MEGEAGLDPRAQPYDNVIQNPKREGMVSSPNNGRSGDGLVRGVSGADGEPGPCVPAGTRAAVRNPPATTWGFFGLGVPFMTRPDY